MGFTTLLMEGLARHCAAAGIGTWSPTGAYPDGATGHVIRSVPQSPDRVLVWGSYGSDDDPTLSDSTVLVQLRSRAGRDPRQVDDLADAVFDVLHGAAGLDLPTGVHVVLAVRTSHAPLGADGNGRHERADNYTVTVHRPSPHRS